MLWMVCPPLSRTYQHNAMAASHQSFEQSARCHRHAIDFRRIRLGDDGDAQTRSRRIASRSRWACDARQRCLHIANAVLSCDYCLMNQAAVELVTAEGGAFRADLLAQFNELCLNADTKETRRHGHEEYRRKRKFWLYRWSCFANGGPPADAGPHSTG